MPSIAQLEVRKIWVENLHSGKYNQGKGALKTRGESKYCCLGVLCVLNNVALLDLVSIYNRHVLNLSGLNDDQISLLIGMNDSDKSFNEIADQIELWTKAGL